MTTINRMENDAYRVNVKGGLDEVLDVTTRILIHGNIRPITKEDIETIRKENTNMGQSALRVLSVAYKDIDEIPEDVNSENIENVLIFIGLLGMIDPARPEVVDAVKKCKTAGIRPVMITGDHKLLPLQLLMR